MPTLVKRHWQANLEAFGGRKARRGFVYQAFLPDEIADLQLNIPADVAEAAGAAASAVRALGRSRPTGVACRRGEGSGAPRGGAGNRLGNPHIVGRGLFRKFSRFAILAPY